MKFLKLNSLLTKISMKWMIVIICVLMLGLFLYYYKKNIMEGFTENGEHDMMKSNSGKNADIYLFYANWCPHCKEAKPIWENFKSEYEKKQINGYKLTFHDIDCSTDTPESSSLMDKFSVEGFPTIILQKEGGQPTTFDSNPSKESLEDFVNSNL